MKLVSTKAGCAFSRTERPVHELEAQFWADSTYTRPVLTAKLGHELQIANHTKVLGQFDLLSKVSFPACQMTGAYFEELLSGRKQVATAPASTTSMSNRSSYRAFRLKAATR
jgi:hypothetical protein